MAALENPASGLPVVTGLPVDDGVADAHVLEEIFRRRERRRGRLLPLHLQLPRGADGVLLALAHDRDVVALAHHLDEAGNVLHRRLVDADERGAGKRRAHVPGVDHARHFHVDRPLQRSVHLRRNVVALRRLADVLHPLHRLQRRDAGGGVGVLAGQRDVEFLAADQLAVGDAAGSGRCRRSRYETTPSLTASADTGTPKCFDAISSSTRRASAATRRIG